MRIGLECFGKSIGKEIPVKVFPIQRLNVAVKIVDIFRKEMHLHRLELTIAVSPFTDTYEIVIGREQANVFDHIATGFEETPFTGFLLVREIGVEVDVLTGISYGEELCLVESHNAYSIRVKQLHRREGYVSPQSG